jgi:hypothetical protein
MTVQVPAARPRTPWIAIAPWAAIAALSCLVILAAQGMGLLSLLLAVLFGVAAALGIAAYAPAALVVLAPALLPPERLWIVFPWELAYLGLAAIVALHALYAKPDWARRLERIEVANLLFVGWAALTIFWSAEKMDWLLGVRRLTGGAITLWLALRLARWVKRPVFEAGLLAAVLSLTLAALGHRQTMGISENKLRLDRAQATNLGWGTANFIATLLLVLTPPLLELALRSRHRWLKIATWPALLIVGLYQVVNASRAATVLFFAGVIVQLVGRSVRRSVALVLGMGALITGIALSPLSQGLLMRFTSLRDLGSMVIRIWYVRAAWRRTIDNFPLGIGLGQGLTYPDHLQHTDPHDYWLAVSSELGVLGVLLWIAVLVMLWRRISAVARTPGWEGMGRALQVSFWLSQLHTIVEPTFQGVQYQFVYFWVMGGYLGYHAVAMERASLREPDSISP